jgi:hypothetical protein
MTNIKKRITKTFIYGLLNFSNIFINKYLLYPLLIFFWKIDIFNDWIFIINIALQFAILDFGSKTYIGNILGKKNDKHIKKYFEYLIAINFISILFILFSAIIFLIFIKFETYRITVDRLNFTILIIINLFILFSNILVGNYGDAVLRPKGLSYKFQKIDFTSNLFINLILILSVFFGFKILAFSILQLILNIIKLLFVKRYCKNKNIETKFIFRSSVLKFNIIKIIVQKSFFFYLGNVNNIIQNSTFLILASIGMGISKIGEFILHKTIANIGSQLNNFIFTAFYYEYTKNNLEKINHKVNLFKLQSKFSNNLTIIINLFLLLVAEQLFKLWLTNNVLFYYSIFINLIICSTIKNYSNSILNFLYAKNCHSNINLQITILSILCLFPSYFLTKNFGIYGLSIFYIVFEVILTLLACKEILSKNNSNYNLINIIQELLKIIFVIILICFSKFEFAFLFILTLSTIEYIIFRINFLKIK